MEVEKENLSRQEIGGGNAFGQLVHIAKILGAVILGAVAVGYIAGGFSGGSIRNCIGSAFGSDPSCSDCSEEFKTTKFLDSGKTEECRGIANTGGDRCQLDCKTTKE